MEVAQTIPMEKEIPEREDKMVLTTLIKQLYAIDTLEGYTDEDIDCLKAVHGILPTVLEEFYRTAGKSITNQFVQDSWITPKNYEDWAWLRNSSHFILLNENQGVCQAGIRQEDMTLSDPPVYVSMDDKDWKLCAPTTSKFLAAALIYEAAFTFDYSSEDIFILSEEDFKLMQSRLTKLPYAMQNWMGCTITCYNNAPDNLAVVLDWESEYQMFYGGATEESYNKLRSVLENVGEPL